MHIWEIRCVVHFPKFCRPSCPSLPLSSLGAFFLIATFPWEEEEEEERGGYFQIGHIKKLSQPFLPNSLFLFQVTICRTSAVCVMDFILLSCWSYWLKGAACCRYMFPELRATLVVCFLSLFLLVSHPHSLSLSLSLQPPASPSMKCLPSN